MQAPANKNPFIYTYVYTLAYRTTLQAFIILTLSSVSHYVVAQQLPEKFTAYYQSAKGFISGESKISLQPLKDGEYLYQSVTSVTGLMSVFASGEIVEQSYWKYHNNKIRPTKYSYQRITRKNRNVEITFDWKNKKVINSINSEPWKMDINDNTLDKLVYQLVMVHDLKKEIEKNKDSKKTLSYSIADGGILKTYEIVIHGKEKINTALGELETVKVTRTRGRRKLTMWCAPKYAYLPMWIKQEKNGGTSYTAKIYKLDGFTHEEM